MHRARAGSRRLCAAVTAGAALVAALPWLTASALGSSLTAHAAANALGVRAFAPRAEPGLGTLLSLASLGGIWNGQAVPASRATLFAIWSAVALLGVVAAGAPAAARRPAAAPLLALAGVSVLVPAALATGPGLHALGALVDAAPGLGVLRDGQKWVALAMPGYALAGAGAVVTLRRWVRPLKPPVVALVCCAALIAALPDLAWGVGAKVVPVRYPPGWAAVAAAVNADPRAVAVLPAGTMRRFSWAGPAPVLDPLPRWVRADVLATGDLVISGVVVPGEGNHARAVQDLLLSGPDPSALARAGVGWLVVESGQRGGHGRGPSYPPRAGTGLPRRPARALSHRRRHRRVCPPDRRAATLIAHLAWLALLIVAAAGAVGQRRAGAARRRPPTRPLTGRPARTASSTPRIASALCRQENSPLRVCALAPSCSRSTGSDSNSSSRSTSSARSSTRMPVTPSTIESDRPPEDR